MRRGYTGRSDAFVKSEQGEQGFWPSYADMMSAMALILFFLMLLSYTQNMITGNNLRNTQKTLTNTEQTLTVAQQNLLARQAELEAAQKELADAQSQLALRLLQVQNAEAELETITADLNAAQLTLDQQQADLDAQTLLLSNQALQLSEQEEQLARQRLLIAQQEAYVQSANEELLNMHNTMATISVLRLSILEQIRDSVAQVMGDPSKVSISDNGSIVLGDGVFFDSGSSDIKSEALPTLDRLIDAFAAILSNPDNTRYIDSIVINGYTDWVDTNWNNRILSTNRANAVLEYMLTRGADKLEPYTQYFSAAGYGEERPVPGTDQNTEAGRAANRRIEISIILKDDSILDIVDSYLNIDLPQGLSANATVLPAG